MTVIFFHTMVLFTVCIIFSSQEFSVLSISISFSLKYWKDVISQSGKEKIIEFSESLLSYRLNRREIIV